MGTFKSNTILSTVVFLLLTNISWSQNIAPILTATGNQAYCPNTQIKIVTDFNVVDPDDTDIDALYIQISTGYDLGNDLLTLSGSHPNIIDTWSIQEGKLTLKGIGNLKVSYIDLISAVKDVLFQCNSNNPSDKGFSITIGDANYLPSTGHYYEYVPSLGITWADAKVAAEARTYFGLQGYLATITSFDEAQLSGKQAGGAGWIGGSDAAVEGVWRWVTGPEADTIFWNGLANGSSPNFAFWNNNEPNQAGNEDYAHVTAPGVGIPGSWNDLSNTGETSGNYQPKGYIVEYGGMPGDPILNISASSTIYTNKITSVKNATRCGAGVVTLEATPLYETVLWFNTPTGGTSLGSGLTFTTPILNTTTTYYALASINGCTTGLRTPVVATVTTIPSIVSVTNKTVCESSSGTLSATASAGVINWYDAPVGGTSLFTGSTFITPVLNATKTYFVDATINGCTTLSRIPVTLTVQITPLPSANASQSFCDIEYATISNLVISGNSILWYISSTGGLPLNTSELLKTNTTYYASQTINTCESLNRLAVNVIVNETVNAPQVTNIPVLYECDTMADGSDTNGYANFNLTANESVLLNGKLSTDYTFYYFTDATYSNPITSPSNTFVNTIQGGQTIYARIVNNNNNACFTDTSFNIKVNTLPIIQPSIVFKNCDEDGMPDGFTDFNLEEANDVISNNNASELIFTYHLSFGDADSGVNNLPIVFNNAISNAVYARVENADGCYRVSTVNLQVSTTSFPLGYLEELTSCDDDSVNDGLHSFDLTVVSSLFISQFPTGQNLSVHYYRNISDAQLEQNEITSQINYTNTVSYSEILYVRVESDDNGDCFGIGPHLRLTVHPRPEFEVDNSAIYCLDNNPITLTTFNPKGNYSYQWQDNTGQIVSDLPYAEVLSGGTYMVTATSSLSCESFPVSFLVVESAIANIDLNDISVVELSDNNSITINNDNNNLGIGDYEFALDAIGGPYKNQPFFERVGAGMHTIYVRDKNLCGIAQLEVFILGFPKFFTPNNDGTNDTWQVRGLGMDFSNASVVNVFDRYGKLIKQINAKNGFWDGTFNGQPLADSDYWFIAHLVEVTGNIRTFRGHFSLIR